MPSADATLDAVRREVAAGREVKVVSPRPSAAHYSVPITGLLAGRRLARVKALSGCERLVLCLEPGVPFAPPGRNGLLSRLSAVPTAVLLARSMRRFQHTTVVETGDTGAPAKATSRLRQAADEVVQDHRDGEPPAGITARGPSETRQRDRVRRLAGKVVRRLLGPRAGSRLRTGLPVVLLMAFVFAVDVACPSGMTADSIRQVSVAVSMVHFHSIGLDYALAHQSNPAAVTMVHGHVYPLFPWGGSIFAVPWVVGYDIAHHLGIGQGSVALVRSGHDWEIQVLSMSAVVAVTAAIVYAIAMRVLTIRPLGRRRRWALAVALAFSFCTPAWSTASRSLWEHGPSMLFIALAVLLALRVDAGETGWTGLGLVLGCSYAMRPTDAIPIALIGVWVLIWHPRKAPRVIAGAIPPLGILIGVDYIAYRQFLTPYYTQGQSFGLSSSYPKVLLANLVSPGRGLLIYVPLVVLSAVGITSLVRSRRLEPLFIAFALIPLAHWLLISGFKHWWAGDAYGPRLFTDLMPIFTVLALPAVDRLAERRFDHQRFAAGLVGVAVLWSFTVHAQGAVLRSAWCWNNEPTDVDAHPSKVWSWSDPQFARGIRTLVWGPHRHWELIRDGVDKIGCPVEPLRP